MTEKVEPAVRRGKAEMTKKVEPAVRIGAAGMTLNRGRE
jgi:hypothetical protein